MRSILSLVFVALLLLSGCSEEPTRPPSPDPTPGWQLLGDRVEGVAQSVTRYDGRVFLATQFAPAQSWEWQDARVRVHVFDHDGWTRIGPEIEGYVSTLDATETGLWLSGMLWRYENRPLNGLLKGDGIEWEPVGPERGDDPTFWMSIDSHRAANGELLFGSVSGVFGEVCHVGERMGEGLVFSEVSIRPVVIDYWQGDLLVAGYLAGDVACAEAPRILRRSDGSWIPFDGDVSRADPCAAIASGTMWDDRLVVTGSRLPGADEASVFTWDGVSWASLGQSRRIQEVRAFGDRLLGWSRYGSVYEWNGDAWSELGSTPPGSVLDVFLVGSKVGICGEHVLGGGYVAVEQLPSSVARR